MYVQKSIAFGHERNMHTYTIAIITSIFFFFPLSVLVYPLSTQRAPDFKEKRDFFVLNIQINVAEDY